MNVLLALHQAGYTVTFETAVKDRISARTGQPFGSEVLTVSIRDGEGHAAAQKDVALRAMSASVDVNLLARLCLQEASTECPKLLAITSKLKTDAGRDPVEFVSENAIDEAYTLMHVALRKSIDGPASVLLWNVLHRLDAQHVNEIAKATSASLRERAAEYAKSGKPLTRYALGIALRDAWSVSADNIWQMNVDRKEDVSPKEFEAEQFNIMVFRQGVEQLEFSDWVWGMTSYLVQDLPHEALEHIPAGAAPVPEPLTDAPRAR